MAQIIHSDKFFILFFVLVFWCGKVTKGVSLKEHHHAERTKRMCLDQPCVHNGNVDIITNIQELKHVPVLDDKHDIEDENIGHPVTSNNIYNYSDVVRRLIDRSKENILKEAIENSDSPRLLLLLCNISTNDNMQDNLIKCPPSYEDSLSPRYIDKYEKESTTDKSHLISLCKSFSHVDEEVYKYYLNKLNTDDPFLTTDELKALDKKFPDLLKNFDEYYNCYKTLVQMGVINQDDLREMRQRNNTDKVKNSDKEEIDRNDAEELHTADAEELDNLDEANNILDTRVYNRKPDIELSNRDTLLAPRSTAGYTPNDFATKYSSLIKELKMRRKPATDDGNTFADNDWMHTETKHEYDRLPKTWRHKKKPHTYEPLYYSQLAGRTLNRKVKEKPKFKETNEQDDLNEEPFKSKSKTNIMIKQYQLLKEKYKLDLAMLKQMIEDYKTDPTEEKNETLHSELNRVSTLFDRYRTYYYYLDQNNLIEEEILPNVALETHIINALHDHEFNDLGSEDIDKYFSPQVGIHNKGYTQSTIVHMKYFDPGNGALQNEMSEIGNIVVRRLINNMEWAANDYKLSIEKYNNYNQMYMSMMNQCRHYNYKCDTVRLSMLQQVLKDQAIRCRKSYRHLINMCKHLIALKSSPQPLEQLPNQFDTVKQKLISHLMAYMRFKEIYTMEGNVQDFAKIQKAYIHLIDTYIEFLENLKTNLQETRDLPKLPIRPDLELNMKVGYKYFRQFKRSSNAYRTFLSYLLKYFTAYKTYYYTQDDVNKMKVIDSYTDLLKYYKKVYSLFFMNKPYNDKEQHFKEERGDVLVLPQLFDMRVDWIASLIDGLKKEIEQLEANRRQNLYSSYQWPTDSETDESKKYNQLSDEELSAILDK